jgi:alpha-D-ribose 1-methylphosphonate 5-triphosphate synthase subunit PhnI
MADTASQVHRSEQASRQAEALATFLRLRGRTNPLAPDQITSQLRALVDKVMGEAGLYDPAGAALALKQSEGDPSEAVVLLRAYRQTLPRSRVSDTLETRALWVRRRISSAFREIPGGQILGPTRDYTQRLLEAELTRETAEDGERFLRAFARRLADRERAPLRTYPKVADMLVRDGLMAPVEDTADPRLQDITREPIAFPAPRSAALQALARAETGALMALAYSGMRGQGGDHPTIGEVRVGRVSVRVKDRNGRLRSLGRIVITEAENISKIKASGKRNPVPLMSLGYGLCFGQNETKAICMGMLDRGMRIPGDGAPAVSQEFVLYHTEGADAWGAVNGLKLPETPGTTSCLHDLRQALDRKQALEQQVKSGRKGSPQSTPSA